MPRSRRPWGRWQETLAFRPEKVALTVRRVPCPHDNSKREGSHYQRFQRQQQQEQHQQ